MKVQGRADTGSGRRAGEALPDMILAAVYSVLVVSFGMFVYVAVDMLRYFFW